MSMWHTSNADVPLATMGIGIAVAKILEELVQATPVLSALSYVVAIVAGLITIYLKLKKKSD